MEGTGEAFFAVRGHRWRGAASGGTGKSSDPSTRYGSEVRTEKEGSGGVVGRAHRWGAFLRGAARGAPAICALVVRPLWRGH